MNNVIDLIWLKILELGNFFWFKIFLTFIWSGIVYFFRLQEHAHTAVLILFLLDGIIGIAHAIGRRDFTQPQLFKKFEVKFFTYSILILTGFALDLALVKGSTEFGFHYICCVFLALTEAASITGHLEAFGIRVPFKDKINMMLSNMYKS